MELTRTNASCKSADQTARSTLAKMKFVCMDPMFISTRDASKNKRAWSMQLKMRSLALKFISAIRIESGTQFVDVVVTRMAVMSSITFVPSLPTVDDPLLQMASLHAGKRYMYSKKYSVYILATKF